MLILTLIACLLERFSFYLLDVITQLSQGMAKLLHVFSDRSEISGNKKSKQKISDTVGKDLMAESMSLEPISVSRALFRISLSLKR